MPDMSAPQHVGRLVPFPNGGHFTSQSLANDLQDFRNGAFQIQRFGQHSRCSVSNPLLLLRPFALANLELEFFRPLLDAEFQGIPCHGQRGILAFNLLEHVIEIRAQLAQLRSTRKWRAQRVVVPGRHAAGRPGKIIDWPRNPFSKPCRNHVDDEQARSGHNPQSLRKSKHPGVQIIQIIFKIEYSDGFPVEVDGLRVGKRISCPHNPRRWNLGRRESSNQIFARIPSQPTLVHSIKNSGTIPGTHPHRRQDLVAALGVVEYK